MSSFVAQSCGQEVVLLIRPTGSQLDGAVRMDTLLIPPPSTSLAYHTKLRHTVEVLFRVVCSIIIIDVKTKHSLPST